MVLAVLLTLLPSADLQITKNNMVIVTVGPRAGNAFTNRKVDSCSFKCLQRSHSYKHEGKFGYKSQTFMGFRAARESLLEFV